MLEYFNQPDFNPDLLDTAFVGLMKQQIYHTGKRPSWFSKLAFHRSFKTDHTPSNYPRNSWEKGICKMTNKQSQTNDRT